MKRALVVLAALLASACSSSYRIVAYVTRRADIDRIPAEELTDINYAFGRIDENGEVVLGHEAPALLSQLQALKARNPKLKVILSVGGWGADNFSNAAFSEFTRMRFAASAIGVIKAYALDGLDLDWEYPGQPGPGIKFLAEDKENFTLLLKTLRRQLDALSDQRKRSGPDRYTLSIATAGGRYFEHTEMDRLYVYVDWINVMGYDYAGPWSAATAHHAALYAPAAEPSSESFIAQHLAAGIPARKIVLGVPFYGRGWCGVEPHGTGLHQPVEAYLGGFPYWMLARQYIDRQGFTRSWDRDARAPYLWNPASATFITYEDPASLREKVKFIKRHHLGGVMYWEQSADPDGVLLETLYDGLK